MSNLATEITYGSTTINYGFDTNGNQISEGTSRSFEWDYGDRMRGFAEGTSVRSAYLYDAGGQRVKKIVRNQQGDSVVTLYIDGGFEHIYKYSSSGVASDAYNELHRSFLRQDKFLIAQGSQSEGLEMHLRGIILLRSDTIWMTTSATLPSRSMPQIVL